MQFTLKPIARLLAMIVMLASGAHAQTLPYKAESRPADPACQNALADVAGVTTGVPADSLAILLARVGPCRPELGRATGFAIRNLQTTTDTNLAATAFRAAPPLVDSAAFAAARDVAGSPAASDLMRVFALRTLVFYLNGGTDPGFASLVSQPRGSSHCSFSSASDPSKTDIFGDYSPLPASAPDDSRAVAVAIQQSASASAALLSASYCVLEAWRQKTQRPSNPHWLFSISKLTVDYVCSSRFRFRNFHPVPVNLQWNVGTLSIRNVSLGAPGSGETYSERLIDAGVSGDLRVYLDGDLLLTRPNLNTPCP